MIPDFPLPEEIELLLSAPVKPLFSNYSMKWLPDALKTHPSLTPQSSQSSFDLKKEASPKPEHLSTHQQLRKSLRRLAFGTKKTTHVEPVKMKQQTINAVHMLAQISTHFLQKL